MSMIVAQNVVYEYPGKRALHDVSFAIEPGTITALVGPNGAGKTTLMRCLAALDTPFSGTIHMAGIDVQEEPRRVHRVLGYLSDFFGLYQDLSARQCLTYMAWINQIPAADVQARVQKAAERLEIAHLLESQAGSLSRGQRQRLAIAQAILHEPQVLILDEPASGLDPEARIGLANLFNSLKHQGMTILVSSHILAELEGYSTHMLVLRDGRVLEHCPIHAAAAAAQLRITVEVQLLEAQEGIAAFLESQEGVSHVTVEGTRVTFGFVADPAASQALLKRLIENGAPVAAFAPKVQSMQDVYMALSNKKAS